MGKSGGKSIPAARAMGSAESEKAWCEQPFPLTGGLSALGSCADMTRCVCDVRFAPDSGHHG